MLRSYNAKRGGGVDRELLQLVEIQTRVFERLAVQLEAIDQKLERMATALEQGNSIAAHPF